MKIQNYHPDTKEFLNESDAAIDPLESKVRGEDIFMLPANATTKALPTDPALPAGHVWVHTPNDPAEWVATVDHRGKTVYNTTTGLESVVDYLGDLQAGFSFDEPVIPPSIQEVEWQAQTYSKNVKVNNQPDKVPQKFEDAMAADVLRDYLLDQAKSLYAQLMENGLSDYPMMEMIGWAKQESEATRWVDDSNGATLAVTDVPAMQYLVAKRDAKALADVSKADITTLAGKILANASIFTLFYANITGQRQWVEFELNKAYNENITNSARRAALLAVNIQSIQDAADEILGS